MTRREALVKVIEDEPSDSYIQRVRDALIPGNDLSIRVGPVFSFGSGESYFSASLWMDVGARTPSWQKVSYTFMADTYAEALALVAQILDEPTGEVATS